jgi:hypothetical protein
MESIMGAVERPPRGGAMSKSAWWAFGKALENLRCQHAPCKGVHGKVLRDDSLSWYEIGLVSHLGRSDNKNTIG